MRRGPGQGAVCTPRPQRADLGVPGRVDTLPRPGGRLLGVARVLPPFGPEEYRGPRFADRRSRARSSALPRVLFGYFRLGGYPRHREAPNGLTPDPSTPRISTRPSPPPLGPFRPLVPAARVGPRILSLHINAFLRRLWSGLHADDIKNS